jgi:divalent anion:Na+ symporter, DASS family
VAHRAASADSRRPEGEGVRVGRLLGTLAVGLSIWLVPAPAGVEPRGWNLLAVFVATIVGLVARPLPMGAVSMTSVAFAVLFGVLPVNEALAGFGNPVVWLVVAAFFFATAFSKTGLGLRIAYHFIRILGKRTLGLGYGLMATDLALSPAVPSNTARAGGVIYPILRSLGHSLGSDAASGTARRLSAFLTVTAYQGTVVTSTMFLTAMAANPLAAELASQQGVTISWATWATAASLPGLLSALLVPLLLFRAYPPEVTDTPDAPVLARRRLAEIGPMRGDEKLLILVFVGLLILWAFGEQLGVHVTAAALGGVGALLLLGVLRWGDLLAVHSAWDTLIWFAILVMMAGQLGELGLLDWFSAHVAGLLGGLSWPPALLGLGLIYFYSHYFFASNTAHVAAMFAPFLSVALAVGTPPLLAALVLSYFSSLFAGLTHYGTAPGPILFGSGNVEIGDWWKLGALVSVLNIVIWLGVGSLWWKSLGFW